MAESRVEQAWNHTAEIEALLANINRDPKRRTEAWTAADFHPFTARRKRSDAPLSADITVLRDAFCPPQPPSS